MKTSDQKYHLTDTMLQEIEETLDLANLQALDAVIGASDCEEDDIRAKDPSYREIAERGLKAAGLVARLVDNIAERKITAY